MDEDRNTPATRGDIRDLRDELRKELHEEMAILGSEMHNSFDDLKETFRDSQTELLKAFSNYSQTNDEGVGATENETTSLKKRLAILESRLKDVEIRLNMPPAA